MKFEKALEDKNLKVEDLPKSQQKKIDELVKLSERIAGMEVDVDDDSKEEFDSIKAKLKQIDEEIEVFIHEFDVEKNREQRARLAAMREKRGVKSSKNSQEVKIESKEEAPKVSEPEPETKPQQEPQKQELKTVDAPVFKEDVVTKNESQINPEDLGFEQEELAPVSAHITNAETEEFEKQGERKPKKANIPLVVMGVGALLLTWGAVNFFKKR